MFKNITMFIAISNLLVMPITAFSSTIPEKSECSVKLEVLDTINTKNEFSDRVTFAVVESDCDFLTVGKNYNSSSIYYKTVQQSFKPKNKIQGEIARSSSMGPDGVVKYALFKSPSFSENFTFSFSFSY